ncbi:MAG: helix-turn-helix transcriptional regulator [Paracoccaceae bacterium]|nr:helix-turn-helix transcriptional regulator [Paracoccaceae bacterium]
MKDWIDPTGDLINSIGENGFASTLVGALRKVAQFDYAVVFGYLGTNRPLDLFDNFPAKKRKIFVEDYQEGPYLLDPFYLATTTPISPGIYRLREIAPDRFYQGEYFRNYYEQTGLAEEIGFLVGLSGGATAVISLMRTNKPFTAKEIRELRQFWPIVRASVQQHWNDLPAQISGGTDGQTKAKIGASVERAFLHFGGGILTPREREVVEFTLKGHSADAVGKILGIASGTVRIHRKNIYSKLRIGSQGELFSRFIATLSDSRNDS